MRNIFTVVSFVAFIAVFALTRDATRRFLESWVELEGAVLSVASFAASVALAAVVAGAVLYVGRLFHGE